MPMRYVNNAGDLYIFDPETETFTKLCDLEEFDIEKETQLMEDKCTELQNAMKTYEKHWYLPVPFTGKRLIFSGLKYIGWYQYK